MNEIGENKNRTIDEGRKNASHGRCVVDHSISKSAFAVEERDGSPSGSVFIRSSSLESNNEEGGARLLPRVREEGAGFARRVRRWWQVAAAVEIAGTNFSTRYWDR